MWPFLLAQVWTCYPICFLVFVTNSTFNDKNNSKFNHHKSKNYKINSKKSQSSKAFQYYKEFISICFKILVLIFLNFIWQNDWIFNNSHTISPNNIESPSCIVIHKRLSNNTNCAMGGTWFEWFQHYKQNKLPSLIDRFFNCPLFHFIFMFLLVMVFNFCSSLFFFSPYFFMPQKLDHAQE
jgi:hypothetical protein